MTRTIKRIAMTTATIVIAIVAGCSGGTRTAGIDRGGAPVGVAVRGPIGGFGSIIVGGTQFDTTTATITVDGQPASEAELAVGQVVTIVGEIRDGQATASSVSYEEDVKGPIQSINVADDRLIVLGQTVLVDNETSFDDEIVPSSLDGLTVGEIVEISGLATANWEILATRIEREAPGGEFEVTGRVALLDTATMRFNINALVVDYSSAALEDFPNGEPVDGDLNDTIITAAEFFQQAGGRLVKTQGTLSGAVIIADEVELDD